MVTVYRMHDDMKNAYRILIRKYEKMGPLRKSRHRWEDNIKMGEGSCEHSNEPFDRIKR